MPYEIKLAPGEELIGELTFQVNAKTAPFTLAISNQALYLPAKKLLSLGDPYYFRRVEHARVRQVSIRALRPYGLWVAGLFMFVVGLTTTVLMVLPFLKTDMTGSFTISGWPLAICVGGVLMPLVARGRVGLIVSLVDGPFRWKPPLVVDRASKKEIEIFLLQIAAACEKAGLTVVDERKRPKTAA